MKVAVTGAAGHLGRVVLRRLLRRAGDLRVVALDREPLRADDPRVEAVRCDVRDPNLGRWLEGCDALLHLAFVVERGVRDEQDAISSSVQGTTNAFLAAAKAGVPHVVYTSSIASYGFHPENQGRVLTEDAPLRGNPEFYYSHSKAEVERTLDVFEADHPQVAVCRLRPSGFLDSQSERGIAAALRGRVFMRFLGASDPLVHLTHQEDVARAVLAAMDRKAQGAFNLATEEPLRISEWGDAMGKRSVNLPRFTPRALGALHRLGLQDTPPGWFTTAASHPIVVDSSKARRTLGWKPVFPTTAVVLRAVAGRATARASRGARLFLGGAALTTRLRGDLGGDPQERYEMRAIKGSLNVILGGARPSEWHAHIDHGRIELHGGLDPEPQGTFSLSDETFLDLLEGKANPSAAQMTGKVRYSGKGEFTFFLGAFVMRYKALREAEGWRGLPRRAFARAILSGRAP